MSKLSRRLSGRLPNRDRRDRKGFALVDVMLVMILVAAAVPIGLQVINSVAERSRGSAASDRMREVTEAAKNYMKVNTEKLLAATTVGGAAIRIPVAKTTLGTEPFAGPNAGLKSLQETGFLPASYVDNNTFGQYHALLVRKNADARLEAMVVTVGGLDIPDGQSGRIAQDLGSEGGFMAMAPLEGSEGIVTGVGGGWGTPGADWSTSGTGPTQGHLATAMALDEGAIVADFLYRRDIGIEEANRMRTNLSMGQGTIRKSITNLRSLIFDNAEDEATDGGTIPNTGRGIDFATGSFLTMQNAVTRIQMDQAGNVTVSDNLTAKAALTAGTNVTAGNDVKAGNNVDAKKNVTAGIDVIAGNDVKAKRFVDADDTSKVVDPQGTSKIFNLELNDIKSQNMSLDTLIYGDVQGSLKPSEKLGSAISRLWGCRLDYRFPNKNGGSWVQGPLLDGGKGSESIGNLAGWSSSDLDDECSGQGCGIQLKVNCTGASSGPGGISPVSPTCPVGMTGQYPNCTLAACPPGLTGTPPNCTIVNCPPGQTNQNGVCRPPEPAVCPGWAPGGYPYCVPIAGSGVDVQQYSSVVSAFRFPNGYISCPGDRKLVGGGASCYADGFQWVAVSNAAGNGWSGGCISSANTFVTLYVTALCAK